MLAAHDLSSCARGLILWVGTITPDGSPKQDYIRIKTGRKILKEEGQLVGELCRLRKGAQWCDMKNQAIADSKGLCSNMLDTWA